MEAASSDVISQVVGALLSWGPPGAIIIIQFVAIYKLYARNQELHSTLYTIGRESIQAYEKISAGYAQMSEAVKQVTTEMNRMADLLYRPSTRRNPTKPRS